MGVARWLRVYTHTGADGALWRWLRASRTATLAAAHRLRWTPLATSPMACLSARDTGCPSAAGAPVPARLLYAAGLASCGHLYRGSMHTCMLERFPVTGILENSNPSRVATLQRSQLGDV